MTAATYQIEDEDETYNTGIQAQCDFGWGGRLPANTAVYAGVKAVFPWFKTSVLDVYVQGPSSKHVLWGVGFEAGGYVAGPYASLTFEGPGTGYLTLTGRVQAAVQGTSRALVGGQLAFGIGSFLLFFGYAKDHESNAILVVGAGFVPAWEYRGQSAPVVPD